MEFKELLREKEAMTAIDDGKLNRAHKRTFLVTRVLGHRLELPGAEEWEISRESAQQCWVRDQKQFTFFFWSPEFGDYEREKANSLTKED